MLERWQIRHMDVQGRRVAYRETGSRAGHPIVLLHAFASSSDTWTATAADLAQAGFRVIAPDLPGHGRSERLGLYSLAMIEDALVSALELLGLQQFDLVGHSLGGYFALRLAARLPDRVRRLVVEATPVPPRHDAEAEAMAAQGMKLTLWRSVRRLGFRRLVRIAVLRQFDFKASRPILWELKKPAPGWWHGLERITSRCLVITSPNDGLISTRAAQLVDHLPNAELMIVGDGHHLHARFREAFLGALVPFLRAPDRADMHLPQAAARNQDVAGRATAAK